MASKVYRQVTRVVQPMSTALCDPARATSSQPTNEELFVSMPLSITARLSFLCGFTYHFFLFR